ncbi:hypothetical protein HRG_002020 [Hirsutella rhossiliensis]|uniref:Uncharacterized protein n=1 Tax=Hirsutella rhossiliensis TaxID=111463 RepID=A0A9P8N603_9HYPO|nr:uncharacterized protein HRG_02020 [Hirsutella rhossiliensis]KAH0966611.1 hypothetical protein HRG_02020 [Hirsutella rhossiliensis]
MPIVNHVVLASGAAVAVSVAVATAVAIYESPELRRYADDVRRRIAIALHSIGDGIEPPHREPRFNRPEDADGFMLSRGAQPGVDADDETRRRQREELLYWNSLRLRAKDEDKSQDEAPLAAAATAAAHVQRPSAVSRGPSFDDFLRQDGDAEDGTYVFNSGADARHTPAAGLRHRGEPAPRALGTSLYANPFADENCIGLDDMSEMAASHVPPVKEEAMSDIYSATTRQSDDYRSATMEPSPVLIDTAPAPAEPEPQPAETLERVLADDEYMSAGQEDRNEAYASIQAWAQDSSRNFYSPLPVTPAAPASEPELVSDGQLTPTDSVSLAGSGEDIANEAQSSRAGETGRPYDVLSESEGMLTPASWSEVGSVVSESEAHGPVHA